mgnify:FL=1
MDAVQNHEDDHRKSVLLDSCGNIIEDEVTADVEVCIMTRDGRVIPTQVVRVYAERVNAYNMMVDEYEQGYQPVAELTNGEKARIGGFIYQYEDAEEVVKRTINEVRRKIRAYWS